MTVPLSASISLRAARAVQALVLAAVLAFAGGATPAAAAAEPRFQMAGISSYRLESGTEVIFYPDASAARASVSLTYRVGSADDPAGAHGLAHLLEHMMFKGTAQTPKLWRELATRGIQFNAATWFERTTYFNEFAADASTLAWVLEMEADRMRNLVFDDEELAREKLVVLNEFDTTAHDRVAATLLKARALLYPEHPYGRPVLGVREHVRTISAAQLAAFHRRHYDPANLTLVVAGRFDPQPTLARIEALFGSAGARPAPPRAMPFEGRALRAGPATVRVVTRGATPAVGLLIGSAPGSDADYPLASLLGAMLAQGESSPLQRRLVGAGIATRVAFFSDGFRDAGDLFVFIEGVAGASADALSRAVDEAWAAALHDVLQAEPLAAEKERRRNALAAALQEPTALDSALLDGIALGDWRLLFGYYGLMQQADPQQLASVAQRYLAIDAWGQQRAARPAQTDVAASARALVEAHAPRVTLAARALADRLPPVDYAGIERATYIRGDGRRMPKVAVYRRDDGRGAVSLALRTWCRGAPSSARARIAALLPDLLAARIALPENNSLEHAVTAANGRLRSAADDQGMLIALEVPAAHLQAIVEHLVRAVPFDDALVAVAQRSAQREVSRLQADRHDPRAAAITALRTRTHPGASPDAVEAAIRDLRSLDADLLRSVWNTCFAPGNVGIAVVGPLDEAPSATRLEAALSTWPIARAEAHAATTDDGAAGAQEALVAVDSARYGFLLARKRLGIDAGHPDYPAYVVANLLLGGSTGGALFTRLRYDEGVSYSVGSFFTPQVSDRASVFGIYASFAPEHFARFRSAVHALIKTPPVDTMLESDIRQTADALRRERRASLANDLVLATTLASNLVTEQTMLDAERADARLGAISVADVRAALTRLLAPEGLSIVFAGDLPRTDDAPTRQR